MNELISTPNEKDSILKIMIVYLKVSNVCEIYLMAASHVVPVCNLHYLRLLSFYVQREATVACCGGPVTVYEQGN